MGAGSTRHDAKLVYSMAYVTEQFHTLLADDIYYCFLGRIYGVNLLDYVKEEDRGHFAETLQQVKKGMKDHCQVHLKNVCDEYVLVDVFIENNDRIIDGEKVWDLKFFDIFYIEEKYILYADNINKYRTFLSVYSDVMYDYDVERDYFSVYRYINNRLVSYYTGTVEDFLKMASVSFSDEKEWKAFENVIYKIKNAGTDFLTNVKAPDLNDFRKTCLYQIDGRILYKKNHKVLFAGAARRLEQDGISDLPYYLTPEGRDPFTGLLNKKACEDYILDSLQNEKDNVHFFCMLDIDNFKQINDQFGHLTGDRVIQQVASILREVVAERGIIGHFGGDEFLIYTDKIKDEFQMRAVIREICVKTTNDFKEEFKTFPITYSMGVSLYPKDGVNYTRLFRVADECLYLAKRKGRNRYIIYEKEKHGELLDKAEGTNAADGMTLINRRTDLYAEYIADVCIRLNAEGKEILPELLDQIRQTFSLGGIRIYSELLDEPIYVSGNYSSIPNIGRHLAGENMQNEFDGKSYHTIGNMESFSLKDQIVYETANEAGIKGVLTCQFPNREGKKIFACFDVFDRNNRWSDEGRNCFIVISKMIAYWL